MKENENKTLEGTGNRTINRKQGNNLYLLFKRSGGKYAVLPYFEGFG